VRGLAQGPLHTAGLPHWLRKCNCQTSQGAAQWVIVYVHGQPRQGDQKHRWQGATGKATTQQRIQWVEPTRVQVAHQRDEADESRGVPSTWMSMSTVEQADQLPWTQVGIAGSRNNLGYSSMSLSLSGLSCRWPQRETLVWSFFFFFHNSRVFIKE